MRDAINPVRGEIRAWAFDEEAFEPEQDWDLHLANLREFDLYVELAAEDDCPKWDYFLNLLYLVVGDAVRTNFQSETRCSIDELLASTMTKPKYRFHLLRERSAALLANPEAFSYDEWCAGLLVTQDLEAARE